MPNLDETVLRLKAHTASKHVDLTLWDNEWKLVEEAVQTAFEFGGVVELTAALHVDVGNGQPFGAAATVKDHQTERVYAEISSLHMDGAPRRYRLIVMDETRKTAGFRMWWDQGDFRGAERNQYDDVVDSRTLSSDVSVALTLFREFYEHRGISESILSATRSDQGFRSVCDLPKK